MLVQNKKHLGRAIYEQLWNPPSLVETFWLLDLHSNDRNIPWSVFPDKRACRIQKLSHAKCKAKKHPGALGTVRTKPIWPMGLLILIWVIHDQSYIGLHLRLVARQPAAKEFTTESFGKEGGLCKMTPTSPSTFPLFILSADIVNLRPHNL